MTRNLRGILLDVAEKHLRFSELPNRPMSREEAADLIPRLPLFAGLPDDFRTELLARFDLAEPAMVAGVDYLPTVFEAHGVCCDDQPAGLDKVWDVTGTAWMETPGAETEPGRWVRLNFDGTRFADSPEHTWGRLLDLRGPVSSVAPAGVR